MRSNAMGKIKEETYLFMCKFQKYFWNPIIYNVIIYQNAQCTYFWSVQKLPPSFQ